jgi:hypothetical protein
MKDYCNHNSSCLRDFLYADFESYISGSVTGCKCCDVCFNIYDCGNCTYTDNYLILYNH